MGSEMCIRDRYSMTLGPIVYCIVAEIGSTRLRTQTVVLGRTTYYIANLIGGVLQPRFMSPTAWNAKGKTVSAPYPTTAISTSTDLLTGVLLGNHFSTYLALGFVQIARDQGPHVRG